MLEKNSTAASLIWEWSTRELPLNSTLSILFLEPLILAARWKKLVFLSPSCSHLVLDFCFQWVSSAWSRFCREHLAWLRVALVKFKGFASILSCRRRMLDSAAKMLDLRTPKTSLFQVLSLCLRDLSFWLRINWDCLEQGGSKPCHQGRNFVWQGAGERSQDGWSGIGPAELLQRTCLVCYSTKWTYYQRSLYPGDQK